MRYPQPTPEELADLAHNPATFPATVWAAVVLTACTLSLFNVSALYTSAETAVVATVAVQPQVQP